MARGEIERTVFVDVKWKLNNYFNLPQKLDTCINSPNFAYAGGQWCLRIFPNGSRNFKRTVGWISLYLVKLQSKIQSHFVKFSIGIEATDGNEDLEVQKESTFWIGNSNGALKLIRSSTLMEEKEIYVPDGNLTVFCNIKVDIDLNETDIVLNEENKCFVETSCQTVPPELQLKEFCPSTKPMISTGMLSRNLKDIFLNQRNCDVVFKVEKEQFPAHKIILEARSPVFAAMFGHNMAEKLSGVVNITDAEPGIFRDMLLYIYSGEIENVSSSNACTFYKLADKYELEELKDWCLEIIEGDISVGNACDVFLLADIYQKSTLKKLAKDFIIENISQILSSEHWRVFAIENPSICVQILELAVLKHAAKGTT